MFLLVINLVTFKPNLGLYYNIFVFLSVSHGRRVKRPKEEEGGKLDRVSRV